MKINRKYKIRMLKHKYLNDVIDIIQILSVLAGAVTYFLVGFGAIIVSLSLNYILEKWKI